MDYVFAPAPAVTVPVAETATADGGRRRFPVRRIYCVGRNYEAHAREMGHDPDREPPFFFSKPADAVLNVAPGATGEFPYPGGSANVHYEMELVVAIGQAGANIPAERALEHVYGYALGLDMTRRDLQTEAKKLGRPWETLRPFGTDRPDSSRRASRPHRSRSNLAQGERHRKAALGCIATDLVDAGNDRLLIDAVRTASWRSNLYGDARRRGRDREGRFDDGRHRWARRIQRTCRLSGRVMGRSR